jgi:hypothetical protein
MVLKKNKVIKPRTNKYNLLINSDLLQFKAEINEEYINAQVCLQRKIFGEAEWLKFT